MAVMDRVSAAGARAGAPPVLAERIAPPPRPSDAVARPRLESLLDRARDCSLTVITAPPGSGKTMLVTQWLAERPAMGASWLTVDADDEPPLFWRSLLHSLARCA